MARKLMERQERESDAAKGIHRVSAEQLAATAPGLTYTKES